MYNKLLIYFVVRNHFHGNILPLILSLPTLPFFSGYEHTSNGRQPPSSPGGSEIHVLLQHGCSRGILGHSDTADDRTSGAATGILHLDYWIGCPRKFV